jgi:hypothetical protein
MRWFKQLTACDEETMVRLMGRDTVIYLIWIRYQAVQFTLIFAFSFASLIPLYWSGNAAQIYTEQFVDANITSN